MNKISADSKKNIIVWSAQFNIGGVYYGVCPLKVMILESHLDTNATKSMILTKVSNLDI